MENTSRATDSPILLFFLPQELRDHIYSYLLDPINATTEHPFRACMPSSSRFETYTSLCLVNRSLYNDAKHYFITIILPNLTFYFLSSRLLRDFQRHALQHTYLQNAHFQIRCGSGVQSPKRMYRRSEAVESLIKIQPGFPWHFTELPGFYRSRPNVQTNYGYFPFTGPHVWKPHRWGVAVFEHHGGEVCDAPNCPQRVRGRPVEVTEVQYPPLQQGVWTAGGEHATAYLVGGERGNLELRCFIWREPAPKGEVGTLEVAIMVLQGKLADVWVPQDPVKVELRQRAQRMG